MGHHCNMRCLHCRRRVADSFRKKQKAMTNSPCKGCERRTARPNCHATCQDYKDFVIERQKYHEERRKQSVIAEYIKSRHGKTGQVRKQKVMQIGQDYP